MDLLSVIDATATADEGVLNLTVKYRERGQEYTVPYGYRPGDPFGLGPQLDAWRVAQPGYPIAPYVAPEPTVDQVEAERERRIALPLDVTLSVGQITVNMEPTAQRDIQGLSTVGLYLTMAQQSTTTSFRDYSNTERELTPADLVSLGLQAAARIQAVYQASWALKALSPIPSDFTDDQYWP